jgi:hypothetical protein
MSEAIERAKTFLARSDTIRAVCVVIASIVVPVGMAIASAVISVSSDGHVKALAFAAVLALAVVGVAFGIALYFLGPKEIFQTVFEYEQLQEDFNILEESTAEVLALPLHMHAVAGIADAAQRCAQDGTWSATVRTVEEVRERLDSVLGRFKDETDHFAALFSFGHDEQFSLSVYLLDEHEQMLHCVYRRRNFLEDWKTNPSRSWKASGAEGGHIGFTMQTRVTNASENIWTSTVLSTLPEKSHDRKTYKSFISSPIFDSGWEGDPASSKVEGVLSVTSSREGHFGPTDQQRRYLILTRLVAGILGPMLKGVKIKP